MPNKYSGITSQSLTYLPSDFVYIYIKPLETFIKGFGMRCLQYTDETQLSFFFLAPLLNTGKTEDVLNQRLGSVTGWTVANKLKLNLDTVEVPLAGDITDRFLTCKLAKAMGFSWARVRIHLEHRSANWHTGLEPSNKGVGSVSLGVELTNGGGDQRKPFLRLALDPCAFRSPATKLYTPSGNQHRSSSNPKSK